MRVASIEKNSGNVFAKDCPCSSLGETTSQAMAAATRIETDQLNFDRTFSQKLNATMSVHRVTLFMLGHTTAPHNPTRSVRS